MQAFFASQDRPPHPDRTVEGRPYTDQSFWIAHACGCAEDSIPAPLAGGQVDVLPP